MVFMAMDVSSGGLQYSWTWKAIEQQKRSRKRMNMSKEKMFEKNTLKSLNF